MTECKVVVRLYTTAHQAGMEVHEFTEKMEDILKQHGGHSLDGDKQWWIDDFNEYQSAITELRNEGAIDYYVT